MPRRVSRATSNDIFFIDSDDLSDPRHIASLGKALNSYLAISRELGPNTSLVLLAKHNDSPQSMDEYNDVFWKLLDGLARMDEKPWPADIPKDIDTDRWCFCYGGEQFFSVIQTPAHINRLSRYSKGVTIVFQPKVSPPLLRSRIPRSDCSLGPVDLRHTVQL